MKSNKGITLVILVAYIVATLFVIGILTIITNNFRNNLDNMDVQASQYAEFDSINMQLLKEVKDSNNLIINESANKEEETKSVKFLNGNTYEYDSEKKAIYMSNDTNPDNEIKIKIADNIDDCNFKVKRENITQVLVAEITIKDTTRTTEYVMLREALYAPYTLPYTDDQGYTAWIPGGFTISGIKSEQSINGGLVIYDITREEEEPVIMEKVARIEWEKDGTEDTFDEEEPNGFLDVRENYNQFVWIPVEVTAEDSETVIASFGTSDWENNERKGDITPEEGTELVKSVYYKKGFYIGRYEAGNSEDSLVIRQNAPIYNEKTAKEAELLANNLYSTSVKGATSVLCSGAAWDGTLDFIKDNMHYVTKKENEKPYLKWGNYSDSEFTVEYGKYYERTWKNVSDLETKILEKEKGKEILLSAGIVEKNSNKNIYDIAGNCWECTVQQGEYYARGGDYNKGAIDIYTNNAPSYSTKYSNAYLAGGDDYSFRPILYVNV